MHPPQYVEKPLTNGPVHATLAATLSLAEPLSKLAEPGAVRAPRRVVDSVADELPSEDGIPLESQLHREQMALLISSLGPWLDAREHETGRGGYVGGNMFVYYRPEPGAAHKNCGPDVFVALDVDPGVRAKWVSWQEGKGPDLVIEFLSKTTRDHDMDGKKQVYQDDLRVPEYYWFDPLAPDEFAGFALCDGVYAPLEPDGDGRLTSRALGGLRLGRWRGRFLRSESTWLRWYTAGGELLLTAAELQATRADRAEHRAGKLARKLRALGIDPGEIP